MSGAARGTAAAGAAGGAPAGTHAILGHIGLVGQIAELQNYDSYKELSWEGSFEDYLEVVRKDPRVVRNASKIRGSRRVQPAELAEIHIEISRLTTPEPLAYDSPDQLLRLLKPGVDGVILKSGHRRATFLPQVWEKIPQPEEFLEHLCLKLGTTADFWRLNNPEVYTYQVEEFHEQSLP